MVFWKALNMSKIQIVRPSVDVIVMVIRMERMPVTGEYDTVKSTPSSTYYLSTNVLEYRSYFLSLSVVFTLKYTPILIVFVSGGNEEREKNGALNVV